ncbi:MAG: hypothetical protein ACO1NX_04945 [Chitinophagaceae bacterium]
MRKYSAIFFLTLLLLSQTPLQDLLKMPVLIAHYGDHKAQKGDISFLDYLKLHYLSEHAKHDTHNNRQLPFHASQIVIMSSHVVVPEPTMMDFVPTVYYRQTYPLLLLTQPLPSRSPEIWQPPKNA